MQQQMYGKVKEKYPDYLRTYHDQINQKYNLWVRFHREELFLDNSEHLKELEFSTPTYSIIVPSSSNELVDEGINNHHCVASYIDDVIEGRTNILFMRPTVDLEQSLITLEYKNNTLIQSKGLSNRHVTDEENEFLLKWMKKFKIKDERDDIEEYQRLKEE